MSVKVIKNDLSLISTLIADTYTWEMSYDGIDKTVLDIAESEGIYIKITDADGNLVNNVIFTVNLYNSEIEVPGFINYNVDLTKKEGYAYLKTDVDFTNYADLVTSMYFNLTEAPLDLTIEFYQIGESDVTKVSKAMTKNASLKIQGTGANLITDVKYDSLKGDLDAVDSPLTLKCIDTLMSTADSKGGTAYLSIATLLELTSYSSLLDKNYTIIDIYNRYRGGVLNNAEILEIACLLFTTGINDCKIVIKVGDNVTYNKETPTTQYYALVFRDGGFYVGPRSSADDLEPKVGDLWYFPESLFDDYATYYPEWQRLTSYTIDGYFVKEMTDGDIVAYNNTGALGNMFMNKLSSYGGAFTTAPTTLASLQNCAIYKSDFGKSILYAFNFSVKKTQSFEIQNRSTQGTQVSKFTVTLGEQYSIIGNMMYFNKSISQIIEDSGTTPNNYIVCVFFPVATETKETYTIGVYDVIHSNLLPMFTPLS